MTIGDILGHEESMLKVWVDERRSRDVNASLMWENLKLFAGTDTSHHNYRYILSPGDL